MKARYARPFCVERPSEWIPHEVRASNGVKMAMIKPGPCFSRDHKRQCADRVLFSNPDKNGVGQVCIIDLHQVWKEW
ncbi:MAG: hypothetical protein IJ662_08895 [Clostridia bacterium]|nr:hypothetical protein [Clostridia bacterium]